MKNGEFWDVTANAFRGCSPASAGCDNCWALRMAWRHAHNPKTKALYAGLVERQKICHREAAADGVQQVKEVVPCWTGQTRYDVAWGAPLAAMKKRQRVFLNGMGDMFHHANKPSDIQHALKVIKAMYQHLFVVITKRPATALYHLKIADWKLPNLILLASAENQDTWNERTSYILDCKQHLAGVGMNCEPLLGPILPGERLAAMDWLIAGGETGHRARFMHPRWAGELAYEANEAGVPFWFKQWGGTARGRVIGGEERNGAPEIWNTWAS